MLAFASIVKMRADKEILSIFKKAFHLYPSEFPLHKNMHKEVKIVNQEKQKEKPEADGTFRKLLLA